MQTIKLVGQSEIIVGETLARISQYLPDKKLVIITDSNLNRIYAEQFPTAPVIEIGTGENIKTLATVENIIEQLIQLEVDRHSFLLAIGGGIVCDIVGFVASVYMRGVDFGFVSSSLLSQVDASVGGKNGVNFNAYKNMIGQFNQPQFVLCDLAMLKSLPKKELLCGMGEILKHALIADAQMFETINQNWEQIQVLEPKLMEDLVFNNIKIKAAIVEKDEREMGERKKLNFGHTLAHAIEKHADISHGEAVAIGIAFAARLSFQKQYLSKNALDSIITTINFLGLPEITNVEKSKLKSAILGDKKRERDSVTFVFLEAIGKARLEEIKIDELKHWIDDLC